MGFYNLVSFGPWIHTLLLAWQISLTGCHHPLNLDKAVAFLQRKGFPPPKPVIINNAMVTTSESKELGFVSANITLVGPVHRQEDSALVEAFKLGAPFTVITQITCSKLQSYSTSWFSKTYLTYRVHQGMAIIIMDILDVFTLIFKKFRIRFVNL